MARERCRVYYSGRVQGVGFRFTALELAQDFAVAGSVRNLDDGRVELVVEGEPDEMALFLDAVRRAFGSKIRAVQVENEPPADPPSSGFEIRY